MALNPITLMLNGSPVSADNPLPVTGLTAAAIIAALGYTPADTASATWANGTAASPGGHFGSALGTGIFKYTAGSSGEGLGFSVSGTSVASLDLRDTAGDDNAWMRLGTGKAVTGTAFMATIESLNTNISGAGANATFLNIAATITATDTVTKTVDSALIELDKLEIMADAGPVTFDRATTVRLRLPVPFDDVTIGRAVGIELPYASTSGTGQITNLMGIRFVTPAGPNITNYYGISFGDAPAGGCIVSEPTVNLTLNGGISGSGSIDLKTQGKLIFQVLSGGGGATGNYITVEANNTPHIKAAHASNANVAMQMSSKGTSSVFLGTRAGTAQFEVQDAANAVNTVSVRGAASGANPRVNASAENLILGPGSALATNATGQFIMIPAMAGTPTGAPTGAGAGAIPFIYDTSANKLWAYNGSWRSVAVA